MKTETNEWANGLPFAYEDPRMKEDVRFGVIGNIYKNRIVREWFEAMGKDFIYSLLSHQRQEILDLVEREVIGEDETPMIESDYPALGRLRIDTAQFTGAITKNNLRAELRQKLSTLREEGKEVGR